MILGATTLSLFASRNPMRPYGPSQPSIRRRMPSLRSADRPAQIAALSAEELGLPFHPQEAVRASRNKFLAREHFSRAGLLGPEYFQVPVHSTAAEAAHGRLIIPCVSEAPWVCQAAGA